MKETTKINDLFIVYEDETLLTNYQTLLVELYQPFIGAFSVALYHTLNYYTKRKVTLSFHKLVSIMGCKFQELPEAFKKLEAAHLLTTYTGEIDDFSVFIYQLNSPLSMYQFFKDPSLEQVLTSYLGPDAVHEMKQSDQEKIQIFEKIQDVKNISHLLKDVYREALVGKSNNQNMGNVAYPHFENEQEVTFHFDTFLIMLPTSVRMEFDFTPNIKHLILKLADMYSLSSEEMAIIFNLSLQKGQGIINEDVLRKEAYTYMVNVLRNENAQNNPTFSLEEKKQVDVAADSQILNSAVKHSLYQMKNISTFDYIKMITESLTPQDYKNVERLILDYNLEQEVANVLINYVYYDKHTLAFPLMEAIAQNWHKRKITTAEEAYLALRENKQQANERQKAKTTRTFDKRTEKISNFDDQKVDLDDQSIEELFKELGE